MKEDGRIARLQGRRECHMTTYHHLRQRLQGGLQLVGGGQGVREEHGSGQQQQRRGNLLVQVQLQPLRQSSKEMGQSSMK